ncbi:MAG: endonuclease/exonuclease/phosphatase family protein [Patescibacteria group bacterium]
MKRILALFALCLSCNTSMFVPGKRYPSECRVPGPILETMTWNVGLAPGVVPHATPRIKLVAEEIANFSDLGVICLQEVWTEEARDAISASLALPSEQVYYVDTRGQGDDLKDVNVCRPSQLDALVSCARDACGDLPDEEHAHCALESCNKEIFALYMRGGEDCLNCLVSSVGLSIDETIRTCTIPGQGVSHSYDGQNGVMLISRWPLKNREAILLPSSIANREALFATVDIDDRESLEIACTHVSTWNELPPSHLGPDGRKQFKDWDAEMNAQIGIISDRLNARAQGRPQLFLGDMNAGPDLRSDMKADMPMVWRRIRALGFSSPAVQAEENFCSVCRGNSLREPSARNKLIDHVLVRDPVGGSSLTPLCTRSLFDADHKRYFRGLDGRMLEEHLSDHYAVTVTFGYE